MTGERDDPYRNFRFKVEIDGIQKAGFAEATIPDSTTDATDYREGTDLPYLQRKLSGLTKYGNITLKRGVSNDKAEWVINDAWPTKYDSSDFSAKASEVVIETLEIVHEGVKRVK